jgi:hypothetical protein
VGQFALSQTPPLTSGFAPKPCRIDNEKWTFVSYFKPSP